MPWKAEDVEAHMKGLSADEKGTWVEVANKALAACEKAGNEDCDASAIKQANAVVGKVREALTPEEETFVEAASLKVLVGRVMKYVGALGSHAKISKGMRKRLSNLQDALTQEHADEAIAIESDSRSSANDVTVFTEDGELVGVEDG